MADSTSAEAQRITRAPGKSPASSTTEGHTAGTRLRLTGDYEGGRRGFVLRWGENRIGKSHDNLVILPEASVSRHHALLELGPDRATLRDLRSTNGTARNGQLLAEDQTVQLAIGDRLRFGTVLLELEKVDTEDAELAFDLRAPANISSASTNPATTTSARASSTHVPAAGASEAAVESSHHRGQPPEVDRETDEIALDEIAGQVRLHIAERMLLTLASYGNGQPDEVLRLLCRELRAKAAGLLEIGHGTEPAVLASSGPLPRVPALDRQLLASPAYGDSAHSSQGEGGAKVWDYDSDLTLATLPHLHDPAEQDLGLEEAVPEPSETRLPTRCLVLLLHHPGKAHQASPSLISFVLCLFTCMGPWAASSPAGPSLGAARREPHLRWPASVVPGRSPAARNLHQQMRSLVRGTLPVLIVGETGVGKELVAKVLHRSSPRAKGPFVAIHCAAIPGDLLEAELFGVAQGAATGVRPRSGKLALAQEGTVLLDEIGDMPGALQAKLLRALEEKEITPLGGYPIRLDIRVLSATNRNLDEAMRAGNFRRDLYYRLAGSVLEVPALRQRREDIPDLLRAFLNQHARTTKKTIRAVSLKALQALIAYDWPGNVRELQHEAHRLAVACADGQVVDSALLAPPILGPESAEPT